MYTECFEWWIEILLYIMTMSNMIWGVKFFTFMVFCVSVKTIKIIFDQSYWIFGSISCSIQSGMQPHIEIDKGHTLHIAFLKAPHNSLFIWGGMHQIVKILCEYNLIGCELLTLNEHASTASEM